MFFFLFSSDQTKEEAIKKFKKRGAAFVVARFDATLVIFEMHIYFIDIGER